eukprot:TRINITY_DN40883_c0_g1_i1.p1 TRINITY_DN40883_c0_g1~~TRINITY_DN40883_c0_g1_i1.p1  ORF type:complete len:423 (-),score=54.01 TRINITY_DN40883_c0_g1_i1:95-1273(-)
MAGAELGAPPSQPQSGFSLFRERLKHPSAQIVVHKMREFVQLFPQTLPRAEAARRLHQFLGTILEMMMVDCAVFAAETDDEAKASTAEGLEKFLISLMHARLFATEATDAIEDAIIRKRIVSLQWITFHHLGVPSVDATLLDLAVQELRRMDSYKAPRDKLVCIINACRVINDVLKLTLEEKGASKRPMSADDFLPLLILCVTRANPPRLNSNLEFIAAFRHPSRLVAEDAYFFTALQSATAFLRDANAKTFEVEPEEYTRLCAQAADTFDRQQVAAAEAAALTASVAATAFNSSTTKTNPASRLSSNLATPALPTEALTVASKAASLPSELRRSLQERLRKIPLRFETVRSGRQVRLGEVPALLAEYKELAQLLHSIEQEGTSVVVNGKVA